MTACSCGGLQQHGAGPGQRLRQADLAAQLVEQDATGGQPLPQWGELAFQSLRGFRPLGPQPYRQPRLVQLQFALHRAQRWQIQREAQRSEEHTSELQSLMRTSYAVFFLKQKNT